MMRIKYQAKIIALWTVFLLGTLFHTQLALMPLFHGLPVAESQKAATMSDISGIMWLMLLFFIVPLIGIIATAFTGAKVYRVIHFCVTLLYSLLNLLHVILDLLVTPVFWYQITLMVFLFLLGLLLNFVSFQWMRLPHRNAKKWRESVTSSPS